MNPPEKKIWFPAKRYGWGWGLPTCWQGWVVMIVWLALTIGGVDALQPCLNTHPILFECFVWGMALVLIIICYWKGEKPRWRWGDKDS